ncbi:MAG: hypothetical protein IIA41_12860 [SAR324 cluster bacterium]|nr:hypothetical protein [SAR324 cluster bacterium]
MNKLWVGFAAGLAALFAASTASAFSIALDVPVAYEFDDGGSADEVSGFKLGLGILTFPAVDFGLGYERYELTEDAGGTDATVTFDIIDVFVDIPFPFINIVIGAGMGRTEFELGTVSKSADVTQWYVSLGYPILLLFDIHVGWHQVMVDEIDVPMGATTVPVDVSGTMWSVGAKLGF